MDLLDMGGGGDECWELGGEEHDGVEEEHPQEAADPDVETADFPDPDAAAGAPAPPPPLAPLKQHASVPAPPSKATPAAVLRLRGVPAAETGAGPSAAAEVEDETEGQLKRRREDATEDSGIQQQAETADTAAAAGGTGQAAAAAAAAAVEAVDYREALQQQADAIQAELHVIQQQSQLETADTAAAAAAAEYQVQADRVRALAEADDRSQEEAAAEALAEAAAHLAEAAG